MRPSSEASPGTAKAHGPGAAAAKSQEDFSCLGGTHYMCKYTYIYIGMYMCIHICIYTNVADVDVYIHVLICVVMYAIPSPSMPLKEVTWGEV